MKFAMLTAGLALAASVVEDVPLTKKTTRHVLKQLNYQFSFEEFSLEYGKSYTAADKPARKAAFEASLQAIKEHNEGTPKPSWFMGLSEHSDKTEAEWSSLKGLHRGAFHTSFGARAAVPVNPAVADFTAPDSLDWRDSGVVTEVKNQGGCGSCWAFSATETVESAYAMALRAKTGSVAAGSIPLLSAQQLVDCAPNPDKCGGTGGCEGSTQPLAFKYLIDAGGHDSESDYAYTARDGTCKDGSNKPVVGITGQEDLPTNNYTALMHALVTAGPIAISVDASWGSYESGVYSPPASGIHTTIDHAVQLVGFGTEGAKEYWLVRNSWGASWGEKGYIKLERFGEGKEPCGTDTRPADGFGCKGGPSSITVCGTSGMLSGSSYPTGAHLL